MTTNQKCKKYLEAHPGATVENWHNQRHRMHIIQARVVTTSKHIGSKPQKKLDYNIKRVPKRINAVLRAYGL